MSTLIENLDSVGGAWGILKSTAFDELLKEAGRTGSKTSVPRLAAQTGVSESFIRSLRGYDVHTERGRRHYTNHERSLILRVLRRLALTEEEFLSRIPR
jgi:hypothetical protein